MVARVIVAGVTTSVSFSMLNSIASSPEQVIRVENFTGLEPSFFDISKRFCDDPLGTYVSVQLSNAIRAH